MWTRSQPRHLRHLQGKQHRADPAAVVCEVKHDGFPLFSDAIRPDLMEAELREAAGYDGR